MLSELNSATAILHLRFLFWQISFFLMKEEKYTISGCESEFLHSFSITSGCNKFSISSVSTKLLILPLFSEA